MKYSDRAWVVTQSLLMLGAVTFGVTDRAAWHSDLGFAVGATLFGVGAVVGVWGVRSLGQNRTPNPTPKADARLVRDGIYRWVRHPLYTSVLTASVGWALMWASGFGMAATVVLGVFFDAKARLEERLLEERFSGYAEYRARTRRFVPGVY